ncbi:MAG: hypothetical protein EPO06_00055 [Burkholderiaceae bacterium]|nr:MAG: hypothetical protein EPO06_00055 [Burkholderiaceae bacterium]
MMKKIMLGYIFISAAMSLASCGQSVQSECEKMVANVYAPLGGVKPENKQAYDMQVQGCVMSKSK